jgi:hypothetical protein
LSCYSGTGVQGDTKKKPTFADKLKYQIEVDLLRRARKEAGQPQKAVLQSRGRLN